MKFFLLLLLPMAIWGWAPQPVTPYPVVGYREVSTFFVWYPVDPQVEGKPSDNPWDLFNIAKDVEIADPSIQRGVIIISHGAYGNPHQLSWLIRGLVHAGFIVLGIQHRDLIEGKAHVNHWMRAKDIHDALTQFSFSFLSKSADLNKVGVAGYSLGGTTAIWLIGGRATKLDSIIPGPEYASFEDFSKADEALPTLNKAEMEKDWSDARIKAAFIMAPAWAWIFDEKSLTQVKIPTYFIATTADQTLVSKNNAGFFASHIPHSIYQQIPGRAGHYVFISALTSSQQSKADPLNKLSFLFLDDPSIDRSWIQTQLIEESVGFFQSTLK